MCLGETQQGQYGHGYSIGKATKSCELDSGCWPDFSIVLSFPSRLYVLCCDAAIPMESPWKGSFRNLERADSLQLTDL